jgi:hypothetical protein
MRQPIDDLLLNQGENRRPHLCRRHLLVVDAASE